MYSLKLEDLFPDLVRPSFNRHRLVTSLPVNNLRLNFLLQPQKKFFDVTQGPKDNDGQVPNADEIPETKSPVLYKMASSPEIGSCSVLSPAANYERKRKEAALLVSNRDATCITIDDADAIRMEARSNSMW